MPDITAGIRFDLTKWAIPICLILLLPSMLVADEWDWSAKAGLNYDFMSHDYYLRTIDTLGLTPDSLLELKSTSDRISEQGILLRFDVENRSELEFKLSNRLYATNEKLRYAIDLNAGWGGLKFLNRTDFKSYNDSEDFSLYSSQFRNSSRLGFRLLDDDNRKLELSEEIEYTGYEQPDPTVTGYYQSESRLRFSQRIGRFTDLSALLRLDLRENYDSVQLNFTRIVADLDFNRFASSGYLSAGLYLERRDYSLPSSEDDYLYLSPTFALDKSLTDVISLAPELELHYYDYDAENFVTFSNARLAADLRLKYHYQLLSTFGLGVGGELFRATEGDFSDQDYSSVQLLAGFETFSSEHLTLTIDGFLGSRNYIAEDESFYTDYDFVRLDILADLKVTESLRFSLIGGTDFEYHSEKEDDVFVYMLSSTVTYRIQ